MGRDVTLFEAPIWAELAPHIHVVTYSRRLDMTQLEFNLPFDLLQHALRAEAACVACGALINPIRQRRVKTAQSRVADLTAAHRPFYAATCPTHMNPSCQRTKVARAHMQRLRTRFGRTLVDDHTRAEAYRHLCTQLLGALAQRDDPALTAWLRARCHAIDPQPFAPEPP